MRTGQQNSKILKNNIKIKLTDIWEKAEKYYSNLKGFVDQNEQIKKILKKIRLLMLGEVTSYRKEHDTFISSQIQRMFAKRKLITRIKIVG